MELFDKVLAALRVKNFEKEAKKETEDNARVGYSLKGVERDVPVNAIIVPAQRTAACLLRKLLFLLKLQPKLSHTLKA